MQQFNSVKVGAQAVLFRLRQGSFDSFTNVVSSLGKAYGHQVAHEFEMALWAVLGDLDLRKALGLDPKYVQGQGPTILAQYSHATPEQVYIVACALLMEANRLGQEDLDRRFGKVFPPSPVPLVGIPTVYVKSWIATIRKNTTDAGCLSVAAQLEAHL